MARATEGIADVLLVHPGVERAHAQHAAEWGRTKGAHHLVGGIMWTLLELDRATRDAIGEFDEHSLAGPRATQVDGDLGEPAEITLRVRERGPVGLMRCVVLADEQTLEPADVGHDVTDAPAGQCGGHIPLRLRQGCHEVDEVVRGRSPRGEEFVESGISGQGRDHGPRLVSHHSGGKCRYAATSARNVDPAAPSTMR